MSEPRDPLLMDHEVDGIQELDNRLPRWWVWLFYLCMIWAALYVLYFEVFRIGPSSAAQYQRDVEAALAALPASTAPVEPLADEASLAQGKALFAKNCIPCHGAFAQGIIGPNLTDNFYLHGPAFSDTVRTINEGVPAKGMITWKTQLKRSEILAVASFVWSIHGSNPANPKAPEGVEVKERPLPKPAEAPAPAAAPAPAPAAAGEKPAAT